MAATGRGSTPLPVAVLPCNTVDMGQDEKPNDIQITVGDYLGAVDSGKVVPKRSPMGSQFEDGGAPRRPGDAGVFSLDRPRSPGMDMPTGERKILDADDVGRGLTAVELLADEVERQGNQIDWVRHQNWELRRALIATWGVMATLVLVAVAVFSWSRGAEETAIFFGAVAFGALSLMVSWAVRETSPIVGG